MSLTAYDTRITRLARGQARPNLTGRPSRARMQPEYITAGAAILSSFIAGLMAWGLRSEVGRLQEKFRADLAEQENRIITRINGTYTRTPVHQDLVARVDRLEGRVDDIA